MISSPYFATICPERAGERTPERPSHSLDSMANLQGFSNLVAANVNTEPKKPKWLNQSDTIHSTQSALPIIDLSEADIESQSAAITAASRRIVNQAKSRSQLKTTTKKTSKKPAKTAPKRRAPAKKTASSKRR